MQNIPKGKFPRFIKEIKFFCWWGLYSHSQHNSSKCGQPKNNESTKSISWPNCSIYDECSWTLTDEGDVNMYLGVKINKNPDGKSFEMSQPFLKPRILKDCHVITLGAINNWLVCSAIFVDPLDQKYPWPFINVHTSLKIQNLLMRELLNVFVSIFFKLE